MKPDTRGRVGLDVPRFQRPHVAPRARTLTIQTAQAARRAKWELAVLIPIFALTLVAYFERERIFGVDAPVRIAAAIVMVALGWAVARDLGRFTAPALFRRMDPATAGTAGFLIRFRFLIDPWRKHQPTLLSADPGQRARRLDFLQRGVEIAAELGADAVSFWSGSAGEPEPAEALRDRLVLGCLELCAHASKCGVRLA